jgi:hypothetical protein
MRTAWSTVKSDLMLTEEEIRTALHADPVAELDAAKFHDPVGLEQLTLAVLPSGNQNRRRRI